MGTQRTHTFHIPVMGLGFTIDTPVKVAHLGISSVVSIVEDHLIETMREVLCKKYHQEYLPINEAAEDSRAKRITAYLNLICDIVNMNVVALKNGDFENSSELNRFFELLPEDSESKRLYKQMPALTGTAREEAKYILKKSVVAGDIDVNIMTKVDKTNYDANGNELGPAYSDAMSALRGFANSKLTSSVVFSAGLNPRLYSYCEQFRDFFPDAGGRTRKKIILKVSDYRSALIQGKFLAKKGIWVSEFRVESGLNCGGHAFATDGLLMGPILDEFKNKRSELRNELSSIYISALKAKGILLTEEPKLKISAQGGIGTAAENTFLRKHYQLDSTGWGSPFLLVPEATNVDDDTLQKLIHAKKEDYYLSHASPLGVPFNNFRRSSSEEQREYRIKKNRPGSPCYKKFLVSNTEFTNEPICTASREYQNLKIKQLKENYTDTTALKKAIATIVEKDCLCEGLGTTARIVNDAPLSHRLKAVTICPGPNLAYFSNVFSLKDMVDHIYGRTNLLNNERRPHMFVNELKLYVDYLKNEVKEMVDSVRLKKESYYCTFRSNLLQGIEYYKSILPEFSQFREVQDEFFKQLVSLREDLMAIQI